MNKKGEYLDADYVKTRFFRQTSEHGLQNTRLARTLDKIAKFNMLFLGKCHTSKAINHATMQFKLEGFKKRKMVVPPTSLYTPK